MSPWLQSIAPQSRAMLGPAGGIAAAGGSVIGGLLQGGAARRASQQQYDAQMAALRLQSQMFGQTQANLAPFISGGAGAFNQLLGRLPSLTAPFQPTQAQLAATPGYQFTRDQGLQATQNSYASRGLGVSGNALTGAATYATGLANTTYNQQLQNYLMQNAQAYNMLMGSAGLGENAAAGLGNISAGIGANLAGNIAGGGNALAAGTIGQAGAYGGIANNVGQYALLNQLMGGSLFGGGGINA